MILICELNNIITRGGKKYFITFIDDFFIFSYVYVLNTKSEALEKFNLFWIEVENQLGKKVKTLRSDRGGEYLSNEFVETYKTLGIIHEITTPYSPQQNGVAERKNRTLVEMVNSTLNSSGLPKNLWGGSSPYSLSHSE